MDVPATVALVIEALALREREEQARVNGRRFELLGFAAGSRPCFALASRLREQRLLLLTRCGLL